MTRKGLISRGFSFLRADIQNGKKFVLLLKIQILRKYFVLASETIPDKYNFLAINFSHLVYSLQEKSRLLNCAIITFFSCTTYITLKSLLWKSKQIFGLRCCLHPWMTMVTLFTINLPRNTGLALIYTYFADCLVGFCDSLVSAHVVWQGRL